MDKNKKNGDKQTVTIIYLKIKFHNMGIENKHHLLDLS